MDQVEPVKFVKVWVFNRGAETETGSSGHLMHGRSEGLPGVNYESFMQGDSVWNGETFTMCSASINVGPEFASLSSYPPFGFCYIISLDVGNELNSNFEYIFSITSLTHEQKTTTFPFKMATVWNV